MEYQLTTLSNGTRLATFEMPHVQSVALGIWAAVGSRYESKPLSGISHFVEHLAFKGTKQRTAREIIRAIEGLGGRLNAFTTDDHTCYYATALGEHFGVLCEVLSDLYMNSKFDPQDIERERAVIREEIRMYRDDPVQHVHRLLCETMWNKHPLGQPITGTVESLSNLTRSMVRRFMAEYYNGHTTIVTAAGNVRHKDLLDQMNRRLGRLPPGRAPRYRRWRVRQGTPNIAVVNQATEQTNLAMGFHTFGRSDDRRFALRLLSVILGENRSSRLFYKLREQHALCYSVQSGMVSLADTGLINIYAGLEAAQLQKTLRLIFREIGRLCKSPPSHRELTEARDYAVGQWFLGLESPSDQMNFMGESILAYGRMFEPASIVKRLLTVTPEEVRRVAAHCFDHSRLGLVVVGPNKNEKEIRRWVG